jgi:hypothetical protein
MALLPFTLTFTFANIVGGATFEPVGFDGPPQYGVGVTLAGAATAFTDATATFDALGNCISLNGAGNIPLASLPSGFHLSSLTNILGTGGIPLGRLWANPDGGANIARGIVTFGSYGPWQTSWNHTTWTGISAPPLLPGPYDILTLFTFLTAEILVNNPASARALVNTSLFLTGLYDIISTQWVVTNLTHPNSNVPLDIHAGDRIQITTPDASFDFTTVTKIKTKNFEITSFITQTSLLLIFEIPRTSSDDSSTLLLMEGTTFVGNAVVTTVNILAMHASGIYKLVAGKTNDTIYDNSSTGNTTTDTKFPDPFIKTGFIGG